MKEKYFGITNDERRQVIWACDSLASVKRHVEEDVALTAHIFGWDDLEDEFFNSPDAYIVSGLRVVASYSYKKGWMRLNGPASVGQLETVKEAISKREEITQGSNPAQAPEAEAAPQAEPEPAPAPEAEAEAAPQAEPEPAPAPDAVALAPEAFRAIMEAVPRCNLLIDLQGDCLRYKNMDGRPRVIYTESITTDSHTARIRYRNGGSRGQITLAKNHDCFPVAAVVAGAATVSDALFDIVGESSRAEQHARKYLTIYRDRKKLAGTHKEELKQIIQRAAVLADQAACIIKNSADGIPLFIPKISEGLEAVAAIANETNTALTAGKHADAVAEWIRNVNAACIEAANTLTKRAETVSNSKPEAEPETAPQVEPEPAPAPEPVEEPEPEAAPQVEPEPVPAPEPVEEPEPEAAPQAEPEPVPAPEPVEAPEAAQPHQAPPKPARGPGKPLDFLGQVLSGPGWQIVFDTAAQRTRVIIEESAREKAAPLAEAAGFYYSVNTDSWHKKLTHKAHRAAVALAEKLRAAC